MDNRPHDSGNEDLIPNPKMPNETDKNSTSLPDDDFLLQDNDSETKQEPGIKKIFPKTNPPERH